MLSLNNASYSARGSEDQNDYILAPRIPLPLARSLRHSLRVDIDLANAAALFLSQARRPATTATTAMTTELIAHTSHALRAPLRLPESARADVVRNAHRHQDRPRHAAAEAEVSPLTSSTPIDRGSRLYIPHPFSLAGVPVLEERIPLEHLPGELLVYDRANATGRHTHRRHGAGRPEKALRYVRLYPRRSDAHLHPSQIPPTPTEAGDVGGCSASGPSTSRRQTRNRGYLFLDPENEAADGRRSVVYRAPLVAALGRQDAGHKGKAREEGGAGALPRRVAVVAKMAKGDCRSHYLLRQEGKAYAELPSHLFGPSESWRGGATRFDACTESGCASSSMCGGAEESAQRVVPNFYGFYVPVDSKGRRLDCRAHHATCDGYLQAGCAVDWPSPILLMEDCGTPVELQGMKRAGRQRCWSLVDSLHASGIAHGSPHSRNILVQPGPLSMPREQRTLATPSFRIASLGRAEALWPEQRAGPPTRLARHCFEKKRELDVQLALSELRLWEEGE
ncbi:hypothetical protein GY45DRAFT_1324620 [Cubamyces sp. BRFM 1775]|nr:hypothetical protein GY45DRAFT_1324620 [Cubamyces sp. BRFM 1775]